MALDNPDRQGFIDAEKTEIQSILNMGTYNPNEILPNPINKTLLGNSKFSYTKKFILMVNLINIKHVWYLEVINGTTCIIIKLTQAE